MYSGASARRAISIALRVAARLGVRRPGERVVAAAGLAAPHRLGHERVDDRRLLAVDLQHSAVPGGGRAWPVRASSSGRRKS